MIFTIRTDGKLYTEAGKSVPYTKLAGYIIEKIHKVKAGKEKGAIKLELRELYGENRQSMPTPVDEAPEEVDDYEPQGEQRMCRTEKIKGGAPNKFLQMQIKPDREAGFDKINDNIKPTPRVREAAPTKKYKVTCHCCGKQEAVPKALVPPTIEGEQMSYRCNKCCKR